MSPGDFFIWDFFRDRPNITIDSLRHFYGPNYFKETQILLARAICGHKDRTLADLNLLSDAKLVEITNIAEQAISRYPDVPLSFLIESFASDYHGIYYFIDKILNHPDVTLEHIATVQLSYIELLKKRYKAGSDIETVMSEKEREVKSKLDNWQ
jgi:hypothetical protein